MRRAAVVIHPAKHDDVDAFRAAVRRAMTEHGWAEPLWLTSGVRLVPAVGAGAAAPVSGPAAGACR